MSLKDLLGIPVPGEDFGVLERLGEAGFSIDLVLVQFDLASLLNCQLGTLLDGHGLVLGAAEFFGLQFPIGVDQVGGFVQLE